ncbi:MAG: hypothetical protein V4819_01070 [Verrucomicrobiota bacterium]
MNAFLTVLCMTACIAFVACAGAGYEKQVNGYPVYKFLNFGGINSKALKVHEAETKKNLGEGYEHYVKQHDLFVSHGFDFHTPLMVRTVSGEEVEVYIRDADHRLLWKTNPHDLADQKKSHRVAITYLPVEIDDEWVNRAVTFSAEMVEREPIIRK